MPTMIVAPALASALQMAQPSETERESNQKYRERGEPRPRLHSPRLASVLIVRGEARTACAIGNAGHEGRLATEVEWARHRGLGRGARRYPGLRQRARHREAAHDARAHEY